MTCIRGSRHNFHMASNPATLFSVTAVILLMTAIACENSDDGLGGDSRATTPRLTVITVTPVPIATADAASSVVSETALPPIVPAAVALVATPNEAISALMPATVPIVAALSPPIPIIQVRTIPTRTTLGDDTLATPSPGPVLTPTSQATIVSSSTQTRAQTAIPTVTLPPTFTPTRTATETATPNLIPANTATPNPSPTASVGGPYSGEAGSAITFSRSATDLGADTLTYEWDFQYNGTTFSTVGATTASGVVMTGPNYTYLTAGTFTVTLRVKDDKGVMTIKSPPIAVTRRCCSSFGQPVGLTEAVLPLPLWCCGGYADWFCPLVEASSARTS